MKNLIKILIFFFAVNLSFANTGIIDTVISYNFGINTQYGHSPSFFPKNIFTKPPVEASKNAPASAEEDICSLGLNGEIVVGFKNMIITDGPGVDFVVFENAFLNPVNKKLFVEPGIVSVSQDGVNFYDFPIDTTELTGCAGINYTNGNADIFDPSVSGGDQFDLKTIGLSYIKYIKIKDFTDYLLSHPKHKYYDAIISGFDLDCVVGINISDETADVIDDETNFKIIDSENSIILQTENESSLMEIYSLNGDLIYKSDNNFINKSELNSGAFLLIVHQDSRVFRKLIMNYK